MFVGLSVLVVGVGGICGIWWLTSEKHPQRMETFRREFGSTTELK